MDRYVLIGQTPVPEPDLLLWAFWMETEDRRVALDRIGRYEVSTVFLGVNHNFAEDGPPLLFETAVFREDPGERRRGVESVRRTASWLEAEAEHAWAVAACQMEARNEDRGSRNR